MAETEDEHWWFVGRRMIIEQQLSALGLPSGAAILEVGAGTGGNLKMLSRYGAVSAMEMHPFAREHATRRSGIEVAEGYLPGNVPFSGKKFDLICLFDVLEHVREDADSLIVLKELLSSRGKIIITVPAYPLLWSDHDVALHHFRRYTRRSLRKVIETSGLRVQKLSNFNTFLFPVATAARGVASLLGTSSSPGSKMPSPLVNKLLLSIFSAERHILARAGLPFGLSLVAVAENA